jgi:hypothetical protein
MHNVAEISLILIGRHRRIWHFDIDWSSSLCWSLKDLSRVSSVDDFSTQDTYLEQIYLLLHIIESRL